MLVISAEGISSALKQLSRFFVDQKSRVEINRADAKDHSTREFSPCLVQIHNPTHRMILSDGRKHNPFATWYETLWVLSGRRELAGLKNFIPRAGEWADDLTKSYWRAAYSPRLRYAIGLDDHSYNNLYEYCKVDRDTTSVAVIGLKPIDQLQYVFDTLSNDPTSRRAVITIWDPAKECTIGKSLDYPCSDLVQFMIRDGKLDCHLYIRSNDFYWGMTSINVFEWTYIQELLANMLDVRVGSYYHYAASLHVYESMMPEIELCANSPAITNYGDFGLKPYGVVFNELEINQYWYYINLIDGMWKMDLESLLHLGGNTGPVMPNQEQELITLMMLYILLKRFPETFDKMYPTYMDGGVRESDWKLAAIHYFNRNRKHIENKSVTYAYEQMKGGLYV